MEIDISGLDKADVLAALYNAAGCFGMGAMQFVPGDMTREDALNAIGGGDDLARNFPDLPRRKQELYFDYLKGRVMKVDLSGDVLDSRLYDRDNGDGAAARALAPLLEKKSA